MTPNRTLEDPDFRALFESAPGLYLVLNKELNIVAVSENYLKATMTKRENILGCFLFDVFPDNPDDLNASGTSNLRASLNRVIKHGTSDIMAIQKYDIRRPAEEGGGFEERYWSPVNSPVLGKNRELQYIIHRVEDVTEFVRLKQEGMKQHQETEELKSHANQLERLRQSQRMEAMGQLAGGVAHDFNNILAIIIMNCEMIMDDTTLSSDVVKSTEQIKKASERAATLTRQLLAFSRKQVLQPRPLNLNSIISELETMLNRLLTEDIEIKTKLSPNLGSVLSDPGQMEQIILNLVVNARDAMPKGGKILLETSNVELDRNLASGNPKVEPGPYVMLSVTDSGVGMDAKTQARIFEPFFTTKAVGKGTGLGLATVYGIVTQNKGTVWVYSELHKGTTFKIYLPLVQEKPNILVSLEAKSLNLSGTETVLVVEDQDEIRELVCKCLRDHGYLVSEASNGAKALALIREQPWAYNLIVTDVVMPEMGGKDLAENLRRMQNKIKILYLSGYTEETLMDYGISGNHPHFLEKPFTLHALLTKVRTILSD